jgi:hypothetical protein
VTEGTNAGALKRQTYEKPMLLKISLVADEVLATNCKAASSNYGATAGGFVRPLSCITTNCKNQTGS